MEISALAASRKLFSNTWLTYDASAFRDGAGAQLHRILSIFALAREIGANYYHTPISSLGYKGTPNSRATSDEIVINGLERTIGLRGDVPPPPDARHVALNSATALSLVRAAGTSQRPALVRLVSGHHFTDRRPGMWSNLAGALPAYAPRRPDVRIAIHVRRGELHFVDSHRMLPNSYYTSVALRIGRLVTSFGLQPRYELFSETLNPGTILTPADFYPGQVRTDQHVGADLDHFSDFSVLEPLDFHFNEPLADTIGLMASADVLVTSRSSLSMVAALLNPQRPILFHPFWHSPLPGWTLTTGDGSFDDYAVLPRLRQRLADPMTNLAG